MGDIAKGAKLGIGCVLGIVALIVGGIVLLIALGVLGQMFGP